MAERVSLLDELRSGRFTGAVLTTYSIDFPFFESVVLRRLLASGCEHQILLVDATQCALAFANPDRRPLLAGTAYTLVPVHVSGAFHPKLLVLLGQKGGKLFVGSHNVTFSGYGGNAELTNLVHAAGAIAREAAPLFRSALGAIRSWATSKTTLAHDALDALERAAPWLAAPAAKLPEEMILWSGAETPPLWEQLRGRLTGRVHRVTVVGPFFDEALSFLLRVQADLTPQELIVGIDSSTAVGLPEPMARFAARFVDVRPMLDFVGIGQSSDLHAKILRIESDTADLLITGSANPSARAWLAKGRNAEAVIVRRSPSSEIMDSMGFSALYNAPEVSAAQWAEIVDRHRARLAAEAQSRTVASVRIGILEGTRIAVHDTGMRPNSVALHLREENVVETASWVLEGDTLLISAPPETLAACHLVELRGTPPVFAVVHHAAQLRPRSTGSVQGPLRAALAGIPDDAEHFDEVLRIVDKAMFDEGIDAAVRSRAMRATQPRVPTEPGETALGSRAIPLEDVKRRGAARRKLADGNLAIVIDMLFHRLGASLEYEAPAINTPEVEEKDLEPLERGAPHDPPPIDSAVLLRVCQRKVKALLDRMVKRLGQVQKGGAGALPAMVQLAAVLGVLRWMHRVEKQVPWLPMGASLMRDGGWVDFFSAVAPYVAPGRASVLERARAEAGDEPWEEASVVLGLLAWTGWQADIDLSAVERHAHDDARDDKQLAYHRAGLLVEILRQIAEDEYARRLLGDAMPRSGRRSRAAEAWLVAHLAWGDALALAACDPRGAPTSKRAIRRGDVVRLDMPDGHVSLAFVVELDDTKIRVADPGEVTGRAVLSRYATVLDLAKLFA